MLLLNEFVITEFDLSRNLGCNEWFQTMKCFSYYDPDYNQGKNCNDYCTTRIYEDYRLSLKRQVATQIHLKKILFLNIAFSFCEFIDDDGGATEVSSEEDKDNEDVEDEEDAVDGLRQQVPAGDDELVAVVRVL